jgi:hypothetical protein
MKLPFTSFSVMKKPRGEVVVKELEEEEAMAI